MLVKNKNFDLNLNEALIRMRKHSVKSKSGFTKSLKIKAPSTRGRLAGPAKA